MVKHITFLLQCNRAEKINQDIKPTPYNYRVVNSVSSGHCRLQKTPYLDNLLAESRNWHHNSLSTARKSRNLRLRRYADNARLYLEDVVERGLYPVEVDQRYPCLHTSTFASFNARIGT